MGAHESPFLFQLSGSCLGEVPTVQCTRKRGEAKEEANGFRGGIWGGGEEEEEEDRRSMTPRTISHFTQACGKQLFFFIPIPSSFGLLPPRQLYKATD